MKKYKKRKGYGKSSRKRNPFTQGSKTIYYEPTRGGIRL